MKAGLRGSRRLGSWAVGGALLVAVSSVGCGPKGPLQVPLHYGPTSAFQVPGIGGDLTAATFAIGEVSDARPGPPDEIGVNVEDSVPVKILATREYVLETARNAIEQTLSSAGLRVQPSGEVRLDFELIHLWVEEENTYKGAVRFRVHVTRVGNPPQVVIVEGNATRFGSSLSEENYTEVVSDSLLRAMENLLKLPAFSDAVAGRTAPDGSEAAAP